MEKFVTPKNQNVSKHIPDDVAFSILLKLPLKSLKLFEFACKSWSMLFENHYFMSVYGNHIILIEMMHIYYLTTYYNG
jgi:molecular chaperone HtpG